MLDFLSGAKTFIGGAVLVGGGTAGMLFGVIGPGTAVMLIGNGFAVWGVGGKLEKLIATQKPVNLKGMNDETPS